MLAEVADIASQVSLVDEPLIKLFGATHVEGGGQEQKGSGWEQGKEYSDDAQNKRDASEDDE